jgi:hypothetical protein
MHTALKTIALSVIAVVMIPAGKARAECAVSPSGWENVFFLPALDATDVPTNTLIWLASANSVEGYFNSAELRLAHDHSEVPVTRLTIETGRATVTVLQPEQYLLPIERYEVCRVNEGQYTFTLTAFTTGTDVDNTPPDRPIEVGRTSDSWNTCLDRCDGKGSSVVIDLISEGIVVADVALMQSLTSESRRRSTTQPSGFVTYATADGVVRLGHGRASPWPGADGETLPIRYAAFDLAGNFSGWTEPVDVRMPKTPSCCGCTSASNRSGSWFLIVLVAISLLIRLRARRKTFGAHSLRVG